MRFAVAFDILRRWLTTGHGYDVTLVRNVTDIDDKILTKAAEADVPWNQWSYNFERATNDALDLLGVLRPSYEPRATGHVTDMVDLIRMLIDKGHAYPAEDGSGDVYFDIKSWPEYGELTRQRIDDMEPAADADPRGKHDPRDFALWKAPRPGSRQALRGRHPWGDGRPGWHLECSAMVRRWLGDTFDIHGGGIDLRFPAPRERTSPIPCCRTRFRPYWMHNGWVTISGEKMSKSLGNSLAVLELTKTVRPLVLRYYLSAVHYRSTIEYQEGSLDEAAAAVDRIEGFLDRALPDGVAESGAIPTAFTEAMDDDLNVSGALAVVFDLIREGNIALDDGDNDRAAEIAGQVIAMTDVLGVNPLAAQWNSGDGGATSEALDALVEALIEARARARKERDFATADKIRDQLTTAGITVEDGPDGARWTVTGKPTKDD